MDIKYVEEQVQEHGINLVQVVKHVNKQLMSPVIMKEIVIVLALLVQVVRLAIQLMEIAKLQHVQL